jgi:hypothetical protein
MLYVTAVPHPKAPQMRRTTFVCYPCNRTWSYTLSADMAERYATDPSVAHPQSMAIAGAENPAAANGRRAV